MMEADADLPDGIDALREIIVAQASELAAQARWLQSRDTLIETLKAQLALEEIETTSSATVVPAPVAASESERTKPSRRPLPDHLPRHEILHELAVCS